MKINSIPIAWDATAPNSPTACAVTGLMWARMVALVAQALLPVWGLGKRRTGRSACATSLLLFCASLHAAQGVGATRTFTDEVGRRVQIPQPVDRVVSLAPNLTEMIFALGEGNHLAGDTDFCDYPAEATQKPHVGGPVNPNMEEIVSLKPDLVLATKSINRRETVNALERIGLPVYVTDPHNVEEMIASVEHVGSALGMEKSAGALVGDLRARLSTLDRRLAGSDDASRPVCGVDRPADFRWTRHVYCGCAAPRGRGDPWWTRKSNGRTSAWKRLSGCSRKYWCSPARMRGKPSTISSAAHASRLAKFGGDPARKHRGDQRCYQSSRAANGGCHRTTRARASSASIHCKRGAFRRS